MFRIFKREMNEYEKKFLDWMGGVPELFSSEEKVRLKSFGVIERWEIKQYKKCISVIDNKKRHRIAVTMFESGEVRSVYTEMEPGFGDVLYDFRNTKGLDIYRNRYKKVKDFSAIKTEEAKKKKQAETYRKLFE